MPSTYTSNGGIEKIGLGEKAGAWGTTTNNNFDIIDRLTNGVGAITLSGTTHTLTTSDGSLSDGMFKVLVLGGSPSGTNTITISPNDADKLYFVQNGTSQTATFTQGSGDNVSILAGEAAIIFADGAGSGAAVTDLSALFPLKSGVAASFTTITAGTSILPDTSGGADIGTADLEFGDVFIADNKAIKFGSGQDVLAKFDTTSSTLQISNGDVSIADDKKLFFGTDKDVSIEYDEDGNNTMLVTGDVVCADGSTSVDIKSHDLSANGLKLDGTLVTASAAEINNLESKIFKNLRCIVCQGQSIAESNSDFAQTIKIVVRDKIDQGDDEKEIYEFLAEKYGEWIIYKPKFNYINSLLWFSPYIVLIFGGLLIFKYLKRRKQ